MREIIKPMQFHDIGKLMLAFVMLFAYFSFSQWLIIWAGNLPEEISWYLHRIRGGWGLVVLVIVLFHFALPFAMLLSRDRKRAGRRLIGLAMSADVHAPGRHLLVRDPEFRARARTFLFSIWYSGAPIGLGGLWLAYFFYNLRQRPLLPHTIRRCRSSCIKDRDMATNPRQYDPLRNPAGRLRPHRPERARNSAVPVGLLVAGIFIELVIWGMFRFMAQSTSVRAGTIPVRW